MSRLETGCGHAREESARPASDATDIPEQPDDWLVNQEGILLFQPNNFTTCALTGFTHRQWYK
jgi:hypothetical protein